MSRIALIVAALAAGDLVITADVYHLARRNFMDALRSSGEITRGPAPLDKTDMQAFAESTKPEVRALTHRPSPARALRIRWLLVRRHP